MIGCVYHRLKQEKGRGSHHLLLYLTLLLPLDSFSEHSLNLYSLPCLRDGVSPLLSTPLPHPGCWLHGVVYILQGKRTGLHWLPSPSLYGPRCVTKVQLFVSLYFFNLKNTVIFNLCPFCNSTSNYYNFSSQKILMGISSRSCLFLRCKECGKSLKELQQAQIAEKFGNT